jgi:hypothetical protein
MQPNGNSARVLVLHKALELPKAAPGGHGRFDHVEAIPMRKTAMSLENARKKFIHRMLR